MQEAESLVSELVERLNDDEEQGITDLAKKRYVAFK